MKMMSEMRMTWWHYDQGAIEYVAHILSSWEPAHSIDININLPELGGELGGLGHFEEAVTAASPTDNVILPDVTWSYTIGYPFAENICVGIIEANSWLSVI